MISGDRMTGDEANTVSEAENLSGVQVLPPANFTMLLAMFSTQAMVALGMIPHPGTGKPMPNLDLAKHFIDLLGVVEEKTRGNLNDSEKSQLEQALHDLRMLYVQKRKD